MIKSNWQKILIIAVLLAGGFWLVSQTPSLEENILQINDHGLQVDVVRETRDMVKGLSGRKSLCSDCGLLFVYPDYQIRTFWMKGMNFPLDIVWLKDEIIVGFEENMQPFDSSRKISTMVSGEQINLVLELNAGWIKKNKVKIGDKVLGLDL